MANYLRPTTIKACLDMMEGDYVFMAGGTDLMVEVRKEPELLERNVIDLTFNPELREIRLREGFLEIGAAASHDDIVTSPLVQKEFKILAEACRTIGSPQIRNRGTLGGSIGTASPASDTLPALLLGDCQVRIVNVSGKEHQVSLQEFMLKPGKVQLEKDELMVSFLVRPLAGIPARFLKVGRRKALAISRLNFALALELARDKVVGDVRIAVGAALPVASRFQEVEDMLQGKVLDRELAEAAADAIRDRILAVTGMRKSSEYKLPVVRDLIIRMLVEMGGIQ